MSEKIYVRRCEKFSIIQATKPVEVDVEKLRKCDPPYVGNSNSELLEYLEMNVIDNYEFTENEHNIEVFGSEEALWDISFQDAEYESYFDSRTKFGDYWTELGIPNEEYRKAGGFDTHQTTYIN
jgi:hypothetical protein